MDEYNAFCSRILLIRYSEEEIQMHDIVAFSTEIDISPNFSSQPLVLEAELLFSDLLTASMGPNKEIVPEKVMRNVSTAVHRINKPCAGICEYVRIVFDEMHFSSVSCTLHCLLTQCKFQSARIQSSDLEFARMGVTRMGKTETQLNVEEVSAILFPDGAETKEYVGSEATNRAYAQYVLAFAKSTEQLRSLISRFLEKGGVDTLAPYRLNLPAASSFSDILSSHACLEVVSKLLEQMKDVAIYARSLYDLLLLVLQDHPFDISIMLREQYRYRMIEQASDAVYREAQRVSEIPGVFIEDIGLAHEQFAQARRRDPYYGTLPKNPIEDLLVFSISTDYPLLFQNLYICDAESSPEKPRSVYNNPVISYPRRKKSHLIVLVHGFGGTAFDVRMLRNHISLEYPDILVLSAHSNEEDATNGDILLMGGKLAIEVMAYVQDYFPRNSLLKLSFIGHSMGGLIIRAALPFLGELKSKFHFYMSLSTPHLGYIHNSSYLVDAGLWVLKKFKHTLSLNQMTLKDDPNLRKCALYTLSTYDGFEDFKHVLFLSSYQDRYAPFESARVQLSQETASDPKFGEIYSEMVKNILQKVKLESVQRVDVNFNLEGGGLDKFIGRAAHIQFLESGPLMNILMFGFSELFKSV